MVELKETEFKVLFELIKNCKKSDRELAKAIGISQPTVTRIRSGLERKGLLEYTAIPDFQKLSFEILAFTFVSEKTDLWRKMSHEEYHQKIRATASAHPNIILWAPGRGLDMTGVLMTVHKNYSDFVQFERMIRSEWGEHLDKVHFFIVTMKDELFKHFSFKGLGDYLR